MNFAGLFLVFSLSYMMPELVSAHSGGLNSQGCHGGSRPYHCHRSPSEMVGNRLRCDLGSRSTECRSTSTTTPSTLRSKVLPAPVKKQEQSKVRFVDPIKPLPEMSLLQSDKNLRARVVMQVQERLKLQGFYDGVVDGLLGPKTKLAIDVFKLSKGLSLGGYLDEQTLIGLGVDRVILEGSQ